MLHLHLDFFFFFYILTYFNNPGCIQLSHTKGNLETDQSLFCMSVKHFVFLGQICSGSVRHLCSARSPIAR